MLEHVLSEELEELIAAKLGTRRTIRTATDPGVDGELAARPARSARSRRPGPPRRGPTLRAAQEALDGHRTGLRALWPFLGPAFIASVAYLDPGNFATDVAGGAKYGYLLLWAVLASNLMAMVVQTLSAKLGIATGRNLAEVCRDEFPRRVSFGLWLQAEVVAMATDLAEVLGAALGLSPALRDPARLGRRDRGRRRLPDPRPPGHRLPAARGRDRRVRRRDRDRLLARAAARHAGPEPDGRPSLLAGVLEWRAADRGRDRRRDGDAARDLPPLGADPEPRYAARTRAS